MTTVDQQLEAELAEAARKHEAILDQLIGMDLLGDYQKPALMDKLNALARNHATSLHGIIEEELIIHSNRKALK